MEDSEFWSQVAEELRRGDLDEGLWLKARTLTQGSKEEAEKAYVVMRVETLAGQKRQADAEAAAKRMAGVKTMRQIRSLRWKDVPDMGERPDEPYRGNKADLVNPIRHDYMAFEVQVHSFVVVDAIKAGMLKGVFDGEYWWVEIKR